jgi:hypothetical protein
LLITPAEFAEWELIMPRSTLISCRARGTAALAVLALFAAATRAPAYIAIAMQPIPETVVLADVVAVGKITSREKNKINAKIYPDAEGKWDFEIFELTTTAVLKGKPAKTIRVAVPRMDYHKRPMKSEVEGRTRLLNPEIKVDAEGSFLLIKHSELDFYVLPPIGGFLDKNEPDYEKELALLRRCAGLLEKPDQGLSSKEREDRFLTAYMLLYDYEFKDIRRMASRGLTEEPIDAKQSKLILKALLEGNWDAPKKGSLSGPLSRVLPQSTIPWLKLDADSMKQRPTVSPFAQEEYAAAGRKWLKDVSETAQLRRLIPAKEKAPK